MRLVVPLCAIAISSLALAQSSGKQSRVPLVDPQQLRALGELPKPGDVQDVLICAGTNEVLWIDVTRKGPEDRAAHEARRKAGWYAAVAMNIFGVQPQAVVDAIAAAKSATPLAKVYETARSCRSVPDSWQVKDL
jgi:hypothetical protein